MCSRAQGIGGNNSVVDRVRQARGISNDDGGVGRGQGIDDATKGMKTTTEASSIQVSQLRLRRRDDGPEELATTT